MLTASLYSTLAGMYLPGEKCILKSVEAYFKNPVYVGDTLKVSGIVKEKDDRFRQATVKAKIINQNGKTVSKATILVGFYE
jgi:3-hydroxybutyryl-CoA dehydratase